MNYLVLDASVAVKWFLVSEEPWKTQALGLLARYRAKEFDLVVPDLFWAEFGNILWKAVRRGRCTRNAAETSIAALKDLDLTTFPCQGLVEQAFNIAAGFDRTFYDRIYVALAIESRAQLITADEKLANALAAHLPVKWLGALS